MKFAVLGIVLAVIVSGCTDSGSSGGTSTGGSVVIKSFSADETSLQGNDRTTLSAEIVNTGDSKATAVKIQLLDLDTACRDDSATSGSSATSSSACESTNTQWGLSSGKTSATLTDLRTNTPGEEAIAKPYNWRVQAPKLPANLPQTYQAKARVSFGYSTTAIKQVKIVTLSEYQRLKTNGQTLPVTTSQPSNGPLKIDVRVNEPVRIEEGATSFMLVVEVTNLAGGNTFLGDNPNTVSQWNLAKLKLLLPSGLEITETDTTSLDDCFDLSKGSGGAQIMLSKGKTYKIACEVKTTSNIAVSIDKTVSVKADYGYFVDASLATPITVTGKANYVAPSGGDAPGQTGGATGDTSGSGTSDPEAPAAVASATFTATAQKDPNTAGKFLLTAQFFQPSDNKGVTAFDIIVDKTQPTNDCGNCVNLARITAPAAKNTGDLITFGPISLDQQSTYYVVVRAKDAAGNIGPVVFKPVQTSQY